MARLQIEINDKLHRVVYIDYDGGLPHQVMTTRFVPTADVKTKLNIYITVAMFYIQCYKSGGGSSRNLDGEVASL